MKCWHCDSEMIWGGDNDFDDFGMEGEGIVSNFSCSSCPVTAEVILPLEEDEETNS